MEAPIVESPIVSTQSLPPVVEAPISIESPTTKSFESGGDINKLELAQMLVLGIIAAAFIYQIAYYKKQFGTTATNLQQMQANLDTVSNNLKKVLGKDYKETV